MPFFDNNGVEEATLHHPIWGAFGLAKERLEQLIVVNLGWSIHLLPALAAFGFPALPLWLRILLFFYTGSALALATGPFFALCSWLCQDEALTLDLVREAIRTYALPGVRRLALLYGIVSLLFWTMIVALAMQITPLITFSQLALLLLLLCSTYWGPTFVAHPDYSSLKLLRTSILYTWRYPGQTLLTCLVIILALVLGVVSIGGIILIVPVIIVLLQSLRYQHIAERKQRRAQAQRVA